ncbi:hypothetical protein AAY473_017332 [Plecturocebus cupreus]
MDESGDHHSQQTDTRTQNQTPHVLTHRQALNNENTWTQEGTITHWGLLEGTRGGTASTVYNSKDLEQTQMPINDRLDKENVACIHHGILCSHRKR